MATVQYAVFKKFFMNTPCLFIRQQSEAFQVVFIPAHDTMKGCKGSIQTISCILNHELVWTQCR
jgi:hypothetical protein